MEATVINGHGTETGQIIATTVGGRNGQPKQVISFLGEHFGAIFGVSFGFGWFGYFLLCD